MRENWEFTGPKDHHESVHCDDCGLVAERTGGGDINWPYYTATGHLHQEGNELHRVVVRSQKVWAIHGISKDGDGV